LGFLLYVLKDRGAFIFMVKRSQQKIFAQRQHQILEELNSQP